jgi:predicted metal-dependent phosphoesterase TrpH
MRRISIGLIAAAILIGTIADRPRPRETVMLGGYRVLAADFHTHSSTWSDGSVTPWGMVIDARYQGLDAIAITGHRQTQDARWGRWFSERIGGPIVLIGEEIPEIPQHVVAVGIQTTVDSALPVGDQIDEIHRQGGIAIAAHPGKFFWPGFEPVMDRLDGTEICHPYTFAYPDAHPELEEFARRADAAAIGSSDFHGPGRLGMCRTFVFVREATAAGILEAIRARRTVVYGGPEAKAYGDPELIRIAEADGRLRRMASTDYPMSLLDRLSQILGIAGFAPLVITSPRRRGTTKD